MFVTRGLPLALAGLLLAGPLAAQRSTTDGFVLEAHLLGAGLQVEDDDDRSDGAGGGFLVGYGFNPKWAAFLQIDGNGFMVEGGSIRGDWSMAHVDLGVRFHFASETRRWVPYLQAAVTGRGVGVDDAEVDGETGREVSFTGGGFSGGGGLFFYPSETLALDLQLMLSGGEFSEVTVNNVTVSGLEIDATSSRLSLGLSWWP